MLLCMYSTQSIHKQMCWATFFASPTLWSAALIVFLVHAHELFDKKLIKLANACIFFCSFFIPLFSWLLLNYVHIYQIERERKRCTFFFGFPCIIIICSKNFPMRDTNVSFQKIGSKIITNRWETEYTNRCYIHSTWNRIQFYIYMCMCVLSLYSAFHLRI